MTTNAAAVCAPAASDIGIAVIGATGRIGRRVLELIAVSPRAARLRIVAAANSRTWLVAREGLPPAQVAASLQAAPPAPSRSFADALARLPQLQILVDCSASADVALCYPRWLAAGIDVVTPNKFGPSADRLLARAINAARSVAGAQIYDSTAVGAQLPLLNTLRDLHAAGDQIERFEAVLSGTLSYVLGRVQLGDALSSAVRNAIDHGYAEPHPARDLSGEDTARKLVILLRALGQDIQLSDVQCVPLADAQLLVASNPRALLRGLEALDETWRARAAVAQARAERWIYRASFDGVHARVAPERVPIDHPLGKLEPCANALILHSRYYCAAPLTISGPGAGVDLTAAGVFSDVLSAARHPRKHSLAVPVEVAA